MATSEFRIILTVTFTDEASRNTAYTALKSQVVNFKNSNPANLKRLDMTRDDYIIPSAFSVTEQI